MGTWGQWEVDGGVRFVKYYERNVAPRGCGARHRVWLGGWGQCRACVSTGQLTFYRITDADATTPWAMQNKQMPLKRGDLPRYGPAESSPSMPAALRLPDDGLLPNPTARSPAGSKPQNQHVHA